VQETEGSEGDTPLIEGEPSPPLDSRRGPPLAVSLWRARGVLLLGVAAISLAATLFKLSAPTHPLIASATRLTIAGLIWGVISLLSRGESPHRPQVASSSLWRAGTLAALCYAIHFGAWVWSLGLTSVIASVALVTTTPLFLGLIGYFRGSDAPSARLWIALLIATIGVSILVFDGLLSTSMQTGAAVDGSAGRLSPPPHLGYSALIGDLLALIGALGMAGYLLVSRSLSMSPTGLALAPFSTITCLGGAFILWICAGCILDDHELTFPQGLPLIALIGAACIPQLIGHTALTWSTRALTPTEVSLATVAEPVGATLLAWIILSERPTLLGALGGVVIIIGLTWAMLDERSTPT
jgi:drug/metabolite transporter (DMT)-like permease